MKYMSTPNGGGYDLNEVEYQFMVGDGTAKEITVQGPCELWSGAIDCEGLTVLIECDGKKYKLYNRGTSSITAITPQHPTNGAVVTAFYPEYQNDLMRLETMAYTVVGWLRWIPDVEMMSRSSGNWYATSLFAKDYLKIKFDKYATKKTRFVIRKFK